MPTYETVFVNRGEAPAEKVQETTEKIKKLIQEKGEILLAENLGRKRMCYEIKGCHDGIYSRIVFASETGFIREIDGFMRVNEDIIRYMIVKAQEPKSRFAGIAEAGVPAAEAAQPAAKTETEKKEE